MIMQVLEEFKKELVYRKYSPGTVNTYVSTLGSVISKIGEQPTVSEIKAHLSAITNRSTHKHHLATIRNYFAFVLKKKLSLKDIPYPRHGNQLPEILSQDEMRNLISIDKNLKHQAIIFLLYGCGLRVGEVIDLKIKDIDPSRMVITIREGKGNKDRQVMLDQLLLDTLRDYERQYKPDTYLFNGQFGLQYSDRSINEFLKYYSKKAGITKRVHAHMLRHSFATHLVDAGTDMSIIQKLMGHSNIKSTQHYVKISTGLISRVKSPLANL